MDKTKYVWVVGKDKNGNVAAVTGCKRMDTAYYVYEYDSMGLDVCIVDDDELATFKC